MPRIAGIDIPENKKVLYALQSIYGVGKKIAQQVSDQAKVDINKRARDLTGEEVSRIQRVLDSVLVEGDLRHQISENLDRLRRIKSYRGLRHFMGLPVRGQRTRVNARTRKGKRRTVGSMTKEMAAKVDAAKAR